jgi:hypothetical protein
MRASAAQAPQHILVFLTPRAIPLSMSYPRWISLSLVLMAVAAARSTSGRAADAGARAAALMSITSDEVKTHVDALADDTFEGREAGSRGGRAAATYIVKSLKDFGLHGGGDKDSFYQNFRNYHNILATVEGRDAELKNQVIVISAHYDHVGYGTPSNSYGPVGRIHNGADDNASGVAALLEVGDALAHLQEKPRRSILLAFWDGEEKGLLGSEHWITHPTVPLDRVRLMINADMVGRLRNSRVEVFGTRTSTGLRKLVSRQNEVPQLVVDFNWQMKPDSDHHTFFQRGIPILMMHTGMHGDYHRPSDDADKINVQGLKQVAQLMFGALVELADAPSLPGFRARSRQEGRGEQSSEVALPQLPSRLGVRWNEAIARKDGDIVVSNVSRGSAAELAGIRVGDKLLSFGGREVHAAQAFRLNVLTAPKHVTATLRRAGTPEPVEVTLELQGEPTRLGISWRTDEAEPGTVIVNRVTAGSSADLAGVRAGDRIYRVNGQEFADAEALRKLATTAEGPTVLEIETAGRVRLVTIPSIDEQLAAISTGNEKTPTDAPKD